MRARYIYAFMFLMLTLVGGAGAQPLCSYNAKISDADKKNSAGASLTVAGVGKASLAAVIRQDRANFYQFKVSDAEDEADCVFGDKQMRSRIEGMINASSIDAKVIENIITKNPIVTIAVYKDRLAISLASATNANTANPNGGKQVTQSSELDKTVAEKATAESIDFRQTANYKIGRCVGFISKEIDTKGIKNVDSRYMKYLEKNNKSVSDVLNTGKNYPQCFENGVNIPDCLQAENVSLKIIGLMFGYNSAISNYNDSADRAIMSLACQ